MESARPAEQADLERLAELVGDAIGASHGQRGADLLLAAAPGADGHALVAGWHGQERAALFVGAYDGVTVGVAAGTTGQVGGRRIGRIECFYVEPEARAVGVGAALIAALVEWFRVQDCTDADAIALPGDRSSKQLLEASGFKARLLLLHRSLE